MKKRTMHMSISNLMISVMVGLTACGNQTVPQSSVKSNEQIEKETTTVETVSEEIDDEASVVEESQELVGSIRYDYEQELNIIDDNYRNYYEVFVYSFYDSDGDGIGDINGVTQKLDYIQDMGFNGIWLMPIMQSTTYHKYDVTDYYAIDKEYGTIDDFQRLVDECHKRDINVVIDFVINHSSSKHQWFQEACAYLRQLPDGQEPDTIC